jgi:hypothetical protein
MEKNTICDFILYKPQENDVLVLLRENLMSLTIDGHDKICCAAEVLRNGKSSFQIIFFSQLGHKIVKTENGTIENTTFMDKYLGFEKFPFGRMIFVSNEKVGFKKVLNKEYYLKKSIFDYHLSGE